MKLILRDDGPNVEIDMPDTGRFQAEAAELSPEEQIALANSVAEQVVAIHEHLPKARRTGAIGMVREALLGLRPVSAAKYRERIAVCLTCDQARLLRGSAAPEGLSIAVQCKVCACVMNIKARISAGACPLEKFD